MRINRIQSLVGASVFFPMTLDSSDSYVTFFTAVGTPPAPPTQMFTITRGCDTTVPFQTPVNCSLERTTGTPNTVGFTRTTSYTCSDNLCNVFTQTDAESELRNFHFITLHADNDFENSCCILWRYKSH